MKKVTDWARFRWGVFYFVLVSLAILFFNNKIFYLKPYQDTYNFPRFVWCVICSFIGFATLVFRLAFKEPSLRSTLPSFIMYYPFILLAISSIAFTLFNGLLVTRGYIFYYASFGFCFTLGYLVDSWWAIVLIIIQKIMKLNK